MLATAAGIVSLVFCQQAADSERVRNAVQAISNNWREQQEGNYPAMYAVSQASRDNVASVLKYGQHNWRSDYRAWLLDHQEQDGLWYAPGDQGGYFCTPLALLVLKER